MIQMQTAKDNYKSQTALYNNKVSSGSKPPMMLGSGGGAYDPYGGVSSVSTPNAAATT